MFKEETYPKPIFSSSMFAVFRTDIEPTDPKKNRGGFMALDENTRPAIYITKEQAERALKQFEAREPDRTFSVEVVGNLHIERAKELDAEMARLQKVEDSYNFIHRFMAVRVATETAAEDKPKESEGGNEQG